MRYKLIKKKKKGEEEEDKSRPQLGCGLITCLSM